MFRQSSWGKILDVSRAQRGPVAAVKLYEQTPLPELLNRAWVSEV